jgi:hypothetical protein
MTRRLGDNAPPSERFSDLRDLQVTWGQNQEFVVVVLVEDRWSGDLCRLVRLVPPLAVALCRVDSVALGFPIADGEHWSGVGFGYVAG